LVFFVDDDGDATAVVPDGDGVVFLREGREGGRKGGREGRVRR